MDALFHFSGGEDEQGHAIANVKNLLRDDSTEPGHVVFVANGDGVFLLTDDSRKREGVASLLADGVSFRACRNSLAGRDLDPADLLDGVETVPAGVGELVKRQDEGYNYLKTP